MLTNMECQNISWFCYTTEIVYIVWNVLLHKIYNEMFLTNLKGSRKQTILGGKGAKNLSTTAIYMAITALHIGSEKAIVDKNDMYTKFRQ